MGYRIVKGLGDTIAQITEATGVAPTVRAVEKMVHGKRCRGCRRARRRIRKALNKAVPYPETERSGTKRKHFQENRVN